MKKFWIMIILLAVFIPGCGGGDLKDTRQQSIEIFIEQRGTRIDISDNTVELRRAPFSLMFRFPRPDSIFINASFKSETFNNALIGLPLNELIGFKNPGIDEEPYNRNSILYVSDNTPNLWYYTDDTDHRFNLIEKKDEKIICRRDIVSIVDIDDESRQTELLEIKQDTLFIVIVSVDWNEDYTRMIEKSRKMLKLKFII